MTESAKNIVGDSWKMSAICKCNPYVGSGDNCKICGLEIMRMSCFQCKKKIYAEFVRDELNFFFCCEKCSEIFENG